MPLSSAAPDERWHLGLIQTKMAPPRLPRQRVGRTALLAALQGVTQRRLTVVSAPAGFGKTTLLTEWHDALQAQGHLTAWLTLDADDDDPQQLGTYLLATLNRGTRGRCAHATDLLRQDPLTPIKTVHGVMLNELGACPEQVYLFLDDFETLGSRHSMAVIVRLLRYAPGNLHLLIGSRKAPALSAGEMWVQEQVLTLNADDLRFTADDAQAFFNGSDGVALDRTGVELLHRATEGWVSGLQLAALALRERGDTQALARELASDQFGIDAYLDSAVLKHMPAATLQFLLRVSILERLCPEVCDAIVGGSSRSWEKLTWLEDHNVFIKALDPQRQWFRFHALMLDALRRRAAVRLSSELPTLHKRASQWFAAQGLWPEAVQHALAGGQIEQAATWAEGCAFALIARSDVRTLLGWFAKLPAELVRHRVRLRLAQAWALSLSFRIQDALHAIATLRQDMQCPELGLTTQGDTDEEHLLHAEVATIHSIVVAWADDAPGALALSQDAAGPDGQSLPWARHFAEAARVFGLAYTAQFDAVRTLLARSHAMLTDEAPLYARTYHCAMLGLSALVEGRLRDATHIFHAALMHAEATVGRDAAAAVLPAGYLVALACERNDIAEAQRLMAGRTTMAMTACPLGSLLRFCWGAARVHARSGDLASALVLLEEGREVATEREWLRLRAGCDAEAVRLLLSADRRHEAQAVIENLRPLMPASLPHPAGSFLETWHSWQVMQARVAMAHGQAAHAQALLTQLGETLSGTGMRYIQAITQLLLAMALEQRGACAAAQAQLGLALAHAAQEPMCASFIDEGEPMLRLLRTHVQETSPETPTHAVAQALLAQAPSAPPHQPRQTPPVGTPSPALSAREVEILRHISQGLSNKEIARALRVAPETVKWHLKNIFEKLNVGSRIEAVQNGLGLMRPPTT